jgi:hypothetical protein
MSSVLFLSTCAEFKYRDSVLCMCKLLEILCNVEVRYLKSLNNPNEGSQKNKFYFPLLNTLNAVPRKSANWSKSPKY